VVVESSSEEEEEEDSSECDAEEMALFMTKFKKYMNKKKLSKGDKKFNTKSTTKRKCYNCGKHGHFIANCPFEHRDDDDDKKKSKFYKKDKGYKKSDKPYKKKSYGETHIDQEWDSNDESSNSINDGVATVAIKGATSSSKSLFPKLNQGKHTCLMAKESKRKVKTKGSSSPRYVTSDDDDASNDDAPLPIGMNEKATIKRLGKELVVWDQLL
jgi:flagellar hook assembly protein FlgD